MSSISSAIIPTKFARSMVKVAEAQGHDIPHILEISEMPFDPRGNEKIYPNISRLIFITDYTSALCGPCKMKPSACCHKLKRHSALFE